MEAIVFIILQSQILEDLLNLIMWVIKILLVY